MARFNLTERLGRLSARERRMAMTLGGIVAFLLLIALPGGLEWSVYSRHGEVADLRGALDAVQSARSQVRDRQARKDAIASRYAKKAPPLAGLLAELARAQKLEVTDSVDRADIPHGKKFTERETTIHLKKSGMASIAKFLEAVESTGYPLSISRLNLRRRMGEPDSYDVELGVSAYDKTEPAPAPSSSAGGARANP